jgi:conjugal transfer pilus assembly protein TraD
LTFWQIKHIAKNTKNTLSIHADEFNELIGDQFIPMINKAGGAGYQVTATSLE